MAFKTKGQLNDHQNRHSNYRPFKCNYCQASFNRKTRLKVHVMIHTGEKPFMCDYPNCNKKFRERGNLNCHYKKHFKYAENKSLLTTTVSFDNAFIGNNNYNNNNNNKEIHFCDDSFFLNDKNNNCIGNNDDVNLCILNNNNINDIHENNFNIGNNNEYENNYVKRDFNENNYNANESNFYQNPDNNFKDVIDKMFGFDSYNNDFFSLNELNLLCEKDEKYENNLIN